MTGAAVELHRVARTYAGPPQVHALRPCELTIDHGDYAAIVGPSGSGKSTLLNILGLLDRPSDGTYLLDGVDTSQMSERERSAYRGHRIGFVFQSFELLPHRPAIDSVCLGLMYRGLALSEQRSRAAAALERVGLSGRAMAPPTQLSGGERQRVAIARAVVGEPTMLLCDEPTGNLDSQNSEDVLASLEELNRQGATVVTITHNPEVAIRASRTIRIRDGVLTEEP